MVVLGLAVYSVEVFGCSVVKVEEGVFVMTVLVVEVEIEGGGDE